MIAEMLSSESPGLPSLPRFRHSIGRILANSLLSMIVNCRASSSGSISSIFNALLVLGIIGGGGKLGVCCRILIIASPPLCWLKCAFGKLVIRLPFGTHRSIDQPEELFRCRNGRRHFLFHGRCERLDTIKDIQVIFC